jgi:hypothetical protein
MPKSEVSAYFTCFSARRVIDNRAIAVFVTIGKVIRCRMGQELPKRKLSELSVSLPIHGDVPADGRQARVN